jgi:4-alpha-glucanotransferase
LHIAVDCLPGLENSDKARKLLAGRQPGFAASRASEFVNYAGYRRQLAPLLEDLFDVFKAEAGSGALTDFARFRDIRGRALSDFALFESLSEEHGPDWRRWPGDLRSAKHPGAQATRYALSGRIQFHAWLQWLCSTQVSDAQSRAKQAGMPLGLYLDLAVGPRRGAAETWCEDDSIAQGVSIGAPSDHLNPGGQNWDLAAYAPGKLAPNRYAAFRQVLRDTMRHAGILRIDHVLGINRSFWIPDDGSPGGYIKQPFHSLLAVIAIEADRARTAIIGEDLGLVPKGFRETINARGLYSYSVLQYEKDADGRLRDPTKLRPQSLACFGTHDTPTLNGFRAGLDIDWWQKLGWIGEDKARVVRCERLSSVSELDSFGDSPTLEGSDANFALPVHTVLARSTVAMVSVQLDDLMGQAEAQNLPGTIDEHPNWRRRAEVSLEQFDVWPELAKTGRMMKKNHRGPQPIDLKGKADET